MFHLISTNMEVHDVTFVQFDYFIHNQVDQRKRS